MRIKEAAALCGLTEKAIRLYEEKGLITPTTTEKNGRTFRDYDTETVARLQTIASLRRAFFSLEQIAEMLDSPEHIPAVYEAYLAQLHQRYAALKPLAQRAEEIDPETLSTTADLAARLTAAAETDGTPVLPTLHFRVWDEEMSRDERDIAYARCQRYISHWGRFYGAYLVFDAVCEWIGRSFKVITAVLAAMLALVLVLYYVPFPVRVGTVLTGYEATIDMDSEQLWQLRKSFQSVEEIESFDISRLPDPTEVVERTVCFDGWILRYAFREDVFIGDVSVSGYESLRLIRHVVYDNDPDDMKPADSRFRFSVEAPYSYIESADVSNVWMIRYDRSAVLSIVNAHENNLTDAVQITVGSAGYYLLDNGEIDPHRIMYHRLGHDRYIFVPAKTSEDVKRMYYTYDWIPREVRIFMSEQNRSEAEG